MPLVGYLLCCKYSGQVCMYQTGFPGCNGTWSNYSLRMPGARANPISGTKLVGYVVISVCGNMGRGWHVSRMLSVFALHKETGSSRFCKCWCGRWLTWPTLARPVHTVQSPPVACANKARADHIKHQHFTLAVKGVATNITELYLLFERGALVPTRSLTP